MREHDELFNQYKEKADILEKEIDVLYDEKRRLEASIGKKSEERKHCMGMLNQIQCRPKSKIVEF